MEQRPLPAPLWSMSAAQPLRKVRRLASNGGCVAVSGVNDRLWGQGQKAQSDRLDDRREVAEAPPCRARATAEERVAAEHVASRLKDEATAAGRVARRVQ